MSGSLLHGLLSADFIHMACQWQQPPAGLQEVVISPNALVPLSTGGGLLCLPAWCLVPVPCLKHHTIKKRLFSSVTPGEAQKFFFLPTVGLCEWMAFWHFEAYSISTEKKYHSRISSEALFSDAECTNVSVFTSSSAFSIDCFYSSHCISKSGSCSCSGFSPLCHLASVHALCHWQPGLMSPPSMYYSVAISLHAA